MKKNSKPHLFLVIYRDYIVVIYIYIIYIYIAPFRTIVGAHFVEIPKKNPAKDEMPFFCWETHRSSAQKGSPISWFDCHSGTFEMYEISVIGSKRGAVLDRRFTVLSGAQPKQKSIHTPQSFNKSPLKMNGLKDCVFLLGRSLFWWKLLNFKVCVSFNIFCDKASNQLSKMPRKHTPK